MNEIYFKISIIDGAINICRHLSSYPEVSLEEVTKHLKSGPAQLACYDYERAIMLGQLVGWDSFSIQGSRQEQLRNTLMNLVIKLKPFWASVSYLGRSKVKQILSNDQYQCLEYAGLLQECPSSDIIIWWDQVAKVFRMIDEEQKVKFGREGEGKTIELEKRRLEDEGINKIPRWVSIDDNTLGYDIISYRIHNGLVVDLKIEVKAYTFGLAHFFISRNEWNTALKNQDSYLFHIWNLETGGLIELTPVEIAHNIPCDQGIGNWQKVKIIMT